MLTLELTTQIAAPPQRVFDLSRSIDLHRLSQAGHAEEAVAGRTSGLIELGESVTWRARHLGVRQHLTSRITAFDPPHHFRDEMERGAFASLVHDHYFEARDGGTRMRDVLRFSAPLGPLGWVAERVLLGRYLRGLIEARNAEIGRVAEGAGWRELLG
jgi:ligand-binding SRPBCC domain-containing protein